MKGRIRAFTILEVSVSMLLAAIIVAIGYTAYDIMARSYTTYHTKHEGLSTLIQMDKLLQKEFYTANTASINDDKLMLKDSVRNIAYQFSADGIVRESVGMDTIRLQVSDVKAWFEAAEVTGVGEGQLIDGLSFSVLYDGKTFMYHYHKNYSSAELFSQQHYAN